MVSSRWDQPDRPTKAAIWAAFGRDGPFLAVAIRLGIDARRKLERWLLVPQPAKLRARLSCPSCRHSHGRAQRSIRSHDPASWIGAAARRPAAQCDAKKSRRVTGGY